MKATITVTLESNDKDMLEIAMNELGDYLGDHIGEFRHYAREVDVPKEAIDIAGKSIVTKKVL